MDELFAGLGGWMNVLIAAAVGVAVYYLAGQNLVWSIVAGAATLLLANISQKDNATAGSTDSNI